MTIETPFTASHLIAAFIEGQDVKPYVQCGSCLPLLVHYPNEYNLYEKLEKFVSTYGKIPCKETFEEVTEISLPVTTEPWNYYHAKLLDRHHHTSMRAAIQQASELLDTKSTAAARTFLTETMNGLTLEQMRPQLHNFRYCHDIVMNSINSKLSPLEKDGLDFGWPTFDSMSNGLREGDLVSFCGRPAVGKSYFSLYSALHAWRVQQKQILFISMEMAPLIIFERLSAMYAGIPAQWVKTGGFPTLHSDTKSKFSAALAELKNAEASFYVLDGNVSATVDEVAGYCRQLKPEGLFIDGAYLLRVPGFHGAKHEKIGEIARQLKLLAIKCGIPVVASWQLNRETTKTKHVGLQHIAGADEIGQLSSVVLAFQQEDTISSVKKRKVTIVKGREGESGSFLVNWNFTKMDFSEAETDFSFDFN